MTERVLKNIKGVSRRGMHVALLNKVISVPLMDCRLGRMVTAPSAISSCCTTGEILDPQLSEPTQMK